MEKKKYARLDRETGKSGESLRVAAAGKGGRPKKTDGAGFLSRQILAIYVGFLQERKASPDWTDRQLNFELFERYSPEDRLQKDPYNGLGHLLGRNSIPRLTAGEKLSTGMVRAEGTGRFAGGLQILYHPYVRLLCRPRTLVDVHTLIALCGSARELDVFRHSPFGVVRHRRSAQEEARAIESHCGKLRQEKDPWQASFLDLFAVAFGLLLEAELTRDPDRLTFWRSWFQAGHLRFVDWPVGGETPRAALDRLVSLIVDGLCIDGISPRLAGFSYMSTNVLASRPVPAESDVRQLPVTPWELGWMFLAIRDGRHPTKTDVAQVLDVERELDAGFPLDTNVRWLQRDR